MLQVHLLIFDSFPETFNKYIIPPAPWPSMLGLIDVLQHLDKIIGGKLAALVGIEYVGCSIFLYRFFKASIQNDVSNVFDTLKDNTFCLPSP